MHFQIAGENEKVTDVFNLSIFTYFGAESLYLFSDYSFVYELHSEWHTDDISS